MTEARAEGGSQTLARGLAALAMIGETEQPPTVPELAARLGIHRSMAYRLVRTLEQHGFVERAADGELRVGLRLVAIARTAARDLQSAAMPALLDVANELDVTAFLVAYDGEAAVTLVSAEPQHAGAPVGQRPGTRHPIDRGAPGRVIRSQLDPVGHPPAAFESSHDEIFEGLSAIAVPLAIPGRRPMSIAAVYLSGRGIDPRLLAARLASAALRIGGAL